MRVGIAETVGRAVESRARKIPAAVNHARAGFVLLGETGAVDRIAEAVGNLELGIECKQQRQTRRFARIDVLLQTREPPAAPQTGVAIARGAQHDGRRMMQETAECLPAKHLVRARIQNELMPQVVHHLRGHRNEAATTLEVSEEILAQCVRNELAVLDAKFGPLLPQLVEQPNRQLVAADVFRARRTLRPAPYGHERASK